MKIKRIFLDLDDVCNEFAMYIVSRMGSLLGKVPVWYGDRSLYKRSWGFDLAQAINEIYNLAPFERITYQELWSFVDESIWASVPPSPEFPSLLELTTSIVGHPNVCILSTPTLDSRCLAGKYKWIMRYCPQWLHNQFLLGFPKHLVAAPGSVLIDDKPENVTKFRQYGGAAILMPRPWNALHDIDSGADARMQYVKRELVDVLQHSLGESHAQLLAAEEA